MYSYFGMFATLRESIWRPVQIIGFDLFIFLPNARREIFGGVWDGDSRAD
jgi:hypothetical protein